MGLFSFFKKPDFPDSIPEVTMGELLQQQLDLIPDYYKVQPQVMRSVKSLAQHEYEPALESLIELAVESGHCLSEHDWKTLAQIATRLTLPARARYCLTESWAAKRRQQDKVEQMRRVDGFYYCAHGRDGMIYYIQQGRVLELYSEVSGVRQFNILIHFQEATHWVLPVKQIVSPEERIMIREQLSKWLGKVRADF